MLANKQAVTRKLLISTCWLMIIIGVVETLLGRVFYHTLRPHLEIISFLTQPCYAILCYWIMPRVFWPQQQKLLHKLATLKQNLLSKYTLTAVIKQIVVCVLYTASFYLLYFFAKNWFSFEHKITWFFPSGLQFIALLLLPYRYWFAVYLGTWAGYQQVHYFYQGEYWPWYSLLYNLVNNFVFIYLPMYIGRRIIAHNWLWSVRGLLVFFLFLIIYRCIDAAKYVFWDNYNVEIVTLGFYLSAVVGGLVAILLITPSSFLVIYLVQLWRTNKSALKHVNFQSIKVPILVVASLVVASSIIYKLQPNLVSFLYCLSFLPIIWFSYRYAWVGAVVTTSLANVLILVSTYQQAPEVLQNAQFYLLAVNLTGLFIGAVITEHKRVTNVLTHKHSQLLQHSEDLKKLARSNAKLAGKVVAVQEQERKQLSQELHDEVGQSLIALKTELEIMDRQYKRGLIQPEQVKELNSSADKIYQSVYQLMHWLRPRVLDDLGLHKTIEGNYFAGRLHKQNVQYCPNVVGDINQLAEKYQIAVFRIVQEAINNCIKYANANRVQVFICLENNQLHLQIRDDGVGFHLDDQSAGFGLEGIKDRVASLQGSCDISSNSQGTQIIVHFDLTQGNN